MLNQRHSKLRTTAVLAGALLLALASIAIITKLQANATASRDARVRLANLQTELHTLQGLPWQATPQQGVSPGVVRRRMHDRERRIERALAGLPHGAADAHLSTAAASFGAYVAALDRVRELVVRRQLGRAGAADAVADRHLKATARALDAASAAYRAHAKKTDQQATFGSAGVIIALLGAFGFFYWRSVSTRSRAQLLEARLQQSQRLETVGQLAGGIAHDFNNLLAVIINYADFVIDELPHDGSARADLEQVRRAAERAALLTRQLLVFSRRELVRRQPLDLNAVVGETERLLARTLGEHVELAVELDPELAPIEADHGQLEQVLLNLVVNARDAMPDGGRLAIETANVELDEEAARTHPEFSPGRYVRLTVTDTGCGMSPEVAEQAFEPFFTTKAKGQGTGLGLATVYGIVKEAGGHVFIYSEPGRGTRIKVDWPTAKQRAGKQSTRPEAPRGAGQTVLVVDDEPAVRESAKRILTSGGYRVLEACSAEQALLVCDEAPRIEVLLTDLAMADISGPELADRLESGGRNLNVLYMSGYGDPIVSSGRERPVVEKPFNSDALLRAVGERLDDHERTVDVSRA